MINYIGLDYDLSMHSYNDAHLGNTREYFIIL